MEDYLQTIQFLSLIDCVAYGTSDDDLQSCGPDSPELTIKVVYDGKDGTPDTFALDASHDPNEWVAETPTAGENEEEITVYTRVGQSELLYQITDTECEALMAVSYGALRH